MLGAQGLMLHSYPTVGWLEHKSAMPGKEAVYSIDGEGGERERAFSCVAFLSQSCDH